MQEFQSSEERPQSLLFDEYTKSAIFKTAKTAGIAAVLSIASTLLGVVVYFVKPPVAVALEGFNNNAMTSLAAGNSLGSIIISVAINGVLFYFLNRFATIGKAGILNENSLQLGAGLRSLATYFKVCFIIFIVSVCLVVVLAIAAAIGSMVG